MSIQYVKSPLFRSHLVDVQIEDPNKKKENIITQLLSVRITAKRLEQKYSITLDGCFISEQTSESDSARNLTLLMNLTRVKLHKDISYPVLM